MKQPAVKYEVYHDNFPYNTALYMRLSRDDGDSGESESIVNQRKILYNYALERGFNVVGEYVDDGWSGTNFNRPGFKQMIKEIPEKSINCVITKDLSRLGRDHVMTGYYIENYFPEKGIRYIAIQEHVDSEKEDNAITPIVNVFNEFYAKQTSKKVRDVFEAKFKDGECHYTYPPMGYDKNPERKNHLIPDPETAWIIQKMFELAENGKGARAIKAWLFDNKVMTPGYRAYLRWGAYAKTYEHAPESRRYEWGIKNIKEILANPLYAGTIVHYRKRTPSYKVRKWKKQPKSKQMVCENTHEPLVSWETFYRVQEGIDIRRRKIKDSNAPHIFAGIAECADCGGYLRFGANRTSPDRVYRYLCCARKSEMGTKKCTPHYTNYDRLCETVLGRIQQLYEQVQIDKASIVKKLSAKAEELDATAMDANIKERDDLNKRKAELENIISKLYENWASNSITQEMFSMMSGKFQEEYKCVTERLTQLPQEDKEETRPKNDAEKLVKLVESISYPTELTSELVNLLIERIVIHEPVGEKYQRGKPQEIEIFWRFSEPDTPSFI